MLKDFKTYKDLINFATSEFRQKGGHTYYELHHILPRNMGGNDSKDNLVLLTIGEHVYAHYLLALECLAKNDKQHYIANIQAAWFICHGKSKFSYWKKLKLEEWLQNEEAQKLSEEIKLRFIENNRKSKPERKVKSLIYKDRIWVQKGTQKPVKILERNFGKGSWVGYNKISDCPICHKPNNESLFACSEAHETLYLQQIKEKYKLERSKQVKERWQDEEYANRIISANTGVSHGHTGIWVTNGIETKMIQDEELDTYIKEGWKRGRSGIVGTPQTEEYKKKLSERRKNSCYVYNDEVDCKEIQKSELEDYLSKGWKKGKRVIYSRKGFKQPPMAWVNNGTEIKKIRKSFLQEYLDNGWKRGRK